MVPRNLCRHVSRCRLRARVLVMEKTQAAAKSPLGRNRLRLGQPPSVKRSSASRTMSHCKRNPKSVLDDYLGMRLPMYSDDPPFFV